MNKNIIFHIPFYADKNHLSGSNIRPYKMIEAFEKIGFNVDVVMGYGAERKTQIENIKNNIEKGVLYDFCYSESSTMPTLLTEKNHLPKYPNLDFGFFKYLKSKNIKIGLFYRDIHWLFEQYKNNVSFLKRAVSTFFYKYDLKKYVDLVDIIYLPSLKMKGYIPINQNLNFKELPPATDKEIEYEKSENKELKIFYVGGMGELYQLDEFFKAVCSLDFVKVTICTREDEWKNIKDRYSPYLNERVNVIHEGPSGYAPYLKEADIAVLFVKPIKYWDFAIPVKLFEYIKYSKPVLSVTGSAVGNFVEKNDIGWVLPYSSYELKNLLTKLFEDKKEIEVKTRNTKEIIPQNTWTARATKVKEDLSK